MSGIQQFMIGGDGTITYEIKGTSIKGQFGGAIIPSVGSTARLAGTHCKCIDAYYTCTTDNHYSEVEKVHLTFEKTGI